MQIWFLTVYVNSMSFNANVNTRRKQYTTVHWMCVFGRMQSSYYIKCTCFIKERCCYLFNILYIFFKLFTSYGTFIFFLVFFWMFYIMSNQNYYVKRESTIFLYLRKKALIFVFIWGTKVCFLFKYIYFTLLDKV